MPSSESTSVQSSLDITFCLFRENLLLVQVGFKSLSYEVQQQKPAYSLTSLFGKLYALSWIVY